MAVSLQQLTSLEGLSAGDINQLAATAKAMFGHPETRKEAQRIMKKINPDVLVPELDSDNAVEQVRKEFETKFEELSRKEIDRIATSNRERSLRDLREAGLPPEAVTIDPKTNLAPIENFMVENGIQKYDAAGRFYLQSQEQAAPTPAIGMFQSSPQVPQLDLKAAGVANVAQWARNEAMQAIADMQSGKVKPKAF